MRSFILNSNCSGAVAESQAYIPESSSLLVVTNGLNSFVADMWSE